VSHFERRIFISLASFWLVALLLLFFMSDMLKEWEKCGGGCKSGLKMPQCFGRRDGGWFGDGWVSVRRRRRSV
jgi:hypothetical protein